MRRESFPDSKEEDSFEGYKSKFQASPKAEEILRTGRILAEDETPQHMIDRMVTTLFNIEKKFGTNLDESKELMEKFGWYIDNKYCVMSTPVMTNAGRHTNKPLSACTVPPIDLQHHLAQAKELVDRFHEDGMGTGFNLDDVEDPVAVLRYLNHIAVEGAKSGREDRPVGNMAVLSVDHPKILDFIHAKTDSDERSEEWKFNISINAGNDFMDAVEGNSEYRLRDGTLLNARQVLESIVASAHKCGDPGLAFIERMNKDNPTPIVGNYSTTAPCAEVGLTPGESCQFGYINVGKFIIETGGAPEIDWGKLREATQLMTRALDNALEISIENYHNPTNSRVMRAKRKIGVGICGLADLLVKIGMPYSSERARTLAKDIVAFINYQSKLESIELAGNRGSFGAMKAIVGCRYNDKPGFIEERYGDLDTAKITSEMWAELGERIRKTKLIRNASTIALPPTGRSGLIIDATPGIEPLFSLVDYNGAINSTLIKDLKRMELATKEILGMVEKDGSTKNVSDLPDDIQDVYRTAIEISPEDHLKMAAALQEAVDESISKTINMPESATVSDIFNIYIQAYKLGLKGITIFRTGSRKIQPRKLANS